MFCTYSGGDTTSKLNFAKIIWWWQFECRDKWTLDSIIKFGCVMKIRLIHVKELFNMCVGSLITWCNPDCHVKFSIASPSELILFWQNQLLDLDLEICREIKSYKLYHQFWVQNKYFLANIGYWELLKVKSFCNKYKHSIFYCWKGGLKELRCAQKFIMLSSEGVLQSRYVSNIQIISNLWFAT